MYSRHMEQTYTNEPTASGQAFTMSNQMLEEREAIRKYTAPKFWSIPASPPGNPSPILEKKFEHYRMLKKRNIHLNDNLDNSKTSRNPYLLDELIDYVDIKDYYGSNLPEELQTWKNLEMLKINKKETENTSSKTQNKPPVKYFRRDRFISE
ncbi:hypothetical protein T552_02593 [Pneumocystis carinii B80]|uniref:Uncharacterized protein n=1 Tax=Pneumocystis carinii (strain B80) TaxID=1408658 RepID=A0A0W4ZFF1_PNEC8|nr:hypothetical protein T552_02593 [Pneumocystis carinii B80]KTW27101.1 hypothetical protein T552_02593 [Pneumocystis carinii B80]